MERFDHNTFPNFKKPVTSVVFILILAFQGFAQMISNPLPQPDISKWSLPVYDDEFYTDKIVCGESAINLWMQIDNCLRNPNNIPERFTRFERLLSNDPVQISLVNKQIRSECSGILADAEAMHKGLDCSTDYFAPMFIMEIALRVPDKLEPETYKIIVEAVKALDIASERAKYKQWIFEPGWNGSNHHAGLTPIMLATALYDDPKVSELAKDGLLAELNHMNGTGDVAEFNVLESHWNGSSSWNVIKRYMPDPYLRRMASMIAERIWINRFLTWSSAVERITGPGSRMAPSEWMGADNERALFATGVTRPIWVNMFFPWDGWDARNKKGPGWEFNGLEATVPGLPDYMQNLAWDKAFPNELQTRLSLVHWKRYPSLDAAIPDPNRPAKYVNYQTENYTIGSTTSSWFVNTCVVAASAWWNNSRSPGAPAGSPERFCLLYPHYVFNGMSTLDKGNIYFEKDPENPTRDEKGGPGGPFLREFVEFGRVGTLQDRNTLLLSYTPNPGTHNIPGEILVKTKTQRASAGMFFFRWTDGLEGIYVNRQPVTSLPCELKPGDWWFIEDGDVYAAIRPLTSTPLKGNCKTVLEKRNHHIVLYQDNVNSDNILGITDEQWVKARSGFIVEMGNSKEYSSFDKFREIVLAGKVTIDDDDSFERHIAYQRENRNMEMIWHSYREDYAVRKISGKDDAWPRFVQSPEFAAGDKGELSVKDAGAKTSPGNTQWLLSCSPSKTWVFYQCQFDKELPVDLTCPAGNLKVNSLPFGKLVLTQKSADEVSVDIDAGYRTPRSEKSNGSTSQYIIYLETPAKNVSALINGITYEAKLVKKSGHKVWEISPFSKINELEQTMLNRPLNRYE